MMAGRVGGLDRPSCYYCHYCDDYEGSGEGRMRKMGFGGWFGIDHHDYDYDPFLSPRKFENFV